MILPKSLGCNWSISLLYANRLVYFEIDYLILDWIFRRSCISCLAVSVMRSGANATPRRILKLNYITDRF